jgi:hypothetical protein
MRCLKPTVDILLGLSTSGVFSGVIGLVSCTSATFPLIFVHLSHGYSHSNFRQRMRYLQDSAFCSRCGCPSFTIVSSVVTLKVFQAAKGVSTSYDALVDLFERFEHYLGRLRIFTEIPSALREVGEILVKIMVELLGVLSLATQKIRQGRFSALFPSLIGHHNLTVMQGSSQSSCWERTISRRCCKDWIDSPRKSRRGRPLRPCKSSMVYSTT